MSIVILDDETIKKLQAFPAGAQLRDAAGNVIGIYRPNTVRVYPKGETPEFDWEELKRPLRDEEKLTTEEVMRRLRSIP
jgi:hypothetical protein